MMPHLVVVPIVLPLLTAASLLFIGAKRWRLGSAINVTATLAGLLVAVELLRRADGSGASGTVAVYLAANWQVPFGISLVADRLSALMLVLVGVVSLCSAIYAEAGWARANVYFYPLFQVQLMGLNGAFLTGDLFNLFVFFEVLLAASYGLQLHGSGASRVRSGMHYIAVNLIASALFLVALALLYGVMGSLSMADIADRLGSIPESDRGIFYVGSTILGVVFLVKAAIWPLNAWLVPAYTAASAPVAALFALMTKVGVYALLRLWMLLFSADAGPFSHFGQPVLLYGGLTTIAIGAIGLMSTIRLGRIAGYSLIVSSGTLLAAMGMGAASVTAAALFYMVSATLAVSALFLVVELVERIGAEGPPRLHEVEFEPDEDTNLDDDETPLVGRSFPVSIALVGMAFVSCALLVSGQPPLSGFVAKLSLLSTSTGQTNVGAPTPAAWWILGLLLVSGLVAMVSLARAGIRHFWATSERLAVRVRALEAASVLALIAGGILLTVWAEPALRYARATATELHAPSGYIQAVLSTQPRPRPSSQPQSEDAL
ncbi:MAG: monovalent cation/H+ antiporter subunit D [Gemmatimonadales bacterium]